MLCAVYKVYNGTYMQKIKNGMQKCGKWAVKR